MSPRLVTGAHGEEAFSGIFPDTAPPTQAGRWRALKKLPIFTSNPFHNLRFANSWGKAEVVWTNKERF
jgi:hypothetical protein